MEQKERIETVQWSFFDLEKKMMKIDRSERIAHSIALPLGIALILLLIQDRKFFQFRGGRPLVKGRSEGCRGIFRQNEGAVALGIGN